MEQMKYIKHDDDDDNPSPSLGSAQIELKYFNFILPGDSPRPVTARRLPLTEKLLTLWWSLNC